jgi:hypothetical protein
MLTLSFSFFENFESIKIFTIIISSVTHNESFKIIYQRAKVLKVWQWIMNLFSRNSRGKGILMVSFVWLISMIFHFHDINLTFFFISFSLYLHIFLLALLTIYVCLTIKILE